MSTVVAAYLTGDVLADLQAIRAENKKHFQITWTGYASSLYKVTFDRYPAGIPTTARMTLDRIHGNQRAVVKALPLTWEKNVFGIWGQNQRAF